MFQQLDISINDMKIKNNKLFVKFYHPLFKNTSKFFEAKILKKNSDNTFKIEFIGDKAYTEKVSKLKKNQKNIANNMAIRAEKEKSKFILNTGDNFYWFGVTNNNLSTLKIFIFKKV